MSIRKVLDGKAMGLMILFCAILGMQQIAIKAAAPDMAPVLQFALDAMGRGMALAFCGIAIAFYDNGAPLTISPGSMFFGDFLGLLAGISWGVTTVVIRPKLSETLQYGSEK